MVNEAELKRLEAGATETEPDGLIDAEPDAACEADACGADAADADKMDDPEPAEANRFEVD